MMLIFWLAVGLAVYFFITTEKTSKVRYEYVKSADEVLRERFVNGDIDEETYRRMTSAIIS